MNLSRFEARYEKMLRYKSCRKLHKRYNGTIRKEIRVLDHEILAAQYCGSRCFLNYVQLKLKNTTLKVMKK